MADYDSAGRSRVKGFTLIELLVVIAIIALLLSILAPAFQKVKEQARALVCATHVKNFSLANRLYANGHDDNIVDGWAWNSNTSFLDALGHDSKQIEDILQTDVMWRRLKDGLICPSSLVGRRGLVESPVTGWPDSSGTTYGYNCGKLGSAVNSLKMSKIGRPVEKVMFIDSSCTVVNTTIDYYTQPDSGLNYKLHWDVLGDVWNPRGYVDPHNDGALSARHNEGAIATFYDGHSERRKKSEFWVLDETGSSDNPIMAAMWELVK